VLREFLTKQRGKDKQKEKGLKQMQILGEKPGDLGYKGQKNKGTVSPIKKEKKAEHVYPKKRS